jgi:hypothetical protein
MPSNNEIPPLHVITTRPVEPSVPEWEAAESLAWERGLDAVERSFGPPSATTAAMPGERLYGLLEALATLSSHRDDREFGRNLLIRLGAELP